MSLKNQAIQTALQGDWQKAVLLNKDLIKQDPKDIDALNRLGLAYTILGKVKEAKSTYQKVVSLDPLNSIALRNLKKLKDKNLKLTAIEGTYQINNRFLEEPGKTKVIELVNIAPARSLESLQTGQMLSLSIKRLKIFVLNGKQYVGVLPDDIAKRLIKFIKAGSQYDAYLKSSNSHRISIFIKEVKKMGRYKDQPSFLMVADSSLVFSKNAKDKLKERDQEDSSYLEEE